jgi:uroporphyrinogen-III synthase
LDIPQKKLGNGLRIDILAPSPNTPSTMALEKYILEANKGK